MKIVKITHREKEWYGLTIEKNHSKASLIRQYKERIWSQSLKMWLFPITEKSEHFLRQLVKNITNPKIKNAVPTSKISKKQKVTLVIRKSNYIRLSNYPGLKVLELLKVWKNCKFYSDSKLWMIPYHPKRLEILKNTHLKLETKLLAYLMNA